MPDYSDRPPVYVLTKEGLKSQEELEALRPKPQEKKYFLGSPWLSGSLMLALLAYYVNSNGWLASAEAYIDQKQQAAGVEPYRLLAQQNFLSYADIASSPSGYTGKAVIWEFALTPEGAAYCEGDPAKKIFFSDTQSTRGNNDPFKALARIEGAKEDLPLLLILQIQ